MSSVLKAKDKVAQKAKRLSARIPIGHSSPSSPPPVQTPSYAADGTDLSIPEPLQRGTEMMKISEKKQRKVVFRLDPDEGQILYKSRKGGIVPIESIKEMRTGANTSYYRVQFSVPEEWESRWLTVIYIVDGTYKTLHMVADTRDVFKLWEVSLRKLHAIRQGLMTGLGNVDLRQTIWERQYWRGADEEGDQKLDFDDVERLCKRLNVSLTKPQLEKMFQQADSQKRGYLDFQDYQSFVKDLKYRPELNSIYGKAGMATEGGKLDFVAFKKFMVDAQKSPSPDEKLKSIFTKYAQSETFSDDLSLSLPQFSSFLLSPDNAVFSEHHKSVWQDMNHPLSDYYISSSHNTYLVGHQLVGVSTIEGYIRALLHSCRTVELDIYDGDEEPVIYHGKTFTSKVSLRDICHAISRYAFVTSPYPIMISAEVHCGLRQQEKMVDIMSEVFGDSLVQAPVDNRPKLEKLPSPEELKHKILLKAKNQYVVAQLAEIKAQRELQKAQHEERISSLLSFTSSSESSSGENDNGGLGQGLKSKWRKFRGKTSPRGAASPPSTTTLTPTGSSASPPSSDKPKPKMSFRLVSLLVYTVGVKCHGVGPESGVEYQPEYIFSLSENAVNRLMKTSGTLRALIKHTQKSLVRTYPKGTRVSSTNYEPHRYWAAGAQVVAINWQTFDLGYAINQAMFQRNGRCGYVLKPLALRAEGEELLKKHTQHFFNVTIISAQQLPRPRDSSGEEIITTSIVDPYVEVTLFIPDWTTSPFLPSSHSYKYKPATDAAHPKVSSPSTPSVTSSARQVSVKTSVIKNNGFNPVWQEELIIPFDCIGGPDGGMRNLIFAEFAVRKEGDSDDDDPIAIYCAPLGTVELGYRHMPLYDMQLSQHMFSTLFVHMAIRDVD
ncbi:1-phosphatidylinositol-4,5-bisphosphate phosphodiesterase 1 [Macrolepiota fuliginosa MF-IS2]|uniref:Phosphoinositide phospholipase C n=1 Tax=Macrolepiota fuliginosa MF-IS2 TaxID=1400762 RepID=A0A9P5X4W3_9AGAR|nr:1-phosphatidylinositol-4,5-bisphosphate phosphodiesterase 1 [Macrolepiota fuliginosa MF-IS2]